MRRGSAQDPRKDEVLRPILVAHREDGDRRWRTVLLALFWPGLASIHGQKRSWDLDQEELWHNIVWVFLEVVCRLDPAKRPDRLVQKIYNDTIHHLHDEYRHRWNRASHESGVEDERLVVLAGGAEGMDIDDLVLREAQEVELRRLRGYVALGLLSEPDLYLLVGTRVYGRPLRDCAAEIGLRYQAAKKRRQRAEANIGPGVRR